MPFEGTYWLPMDVGVSAEDPPQITGWTCHGPALHEGRGAEPNLFSRVLIAAESTKLEQDLACPRACPIEFFDPRT
jgi:hypothetical protein